MTGFTFQLNCFSPTQFKDVAQQYVIGCHGNDVFGQVNNWKTDPNKPSGNFDVLINEVVGLTSVSGHTLAAGWRLLISLGNDGNGNITGATFSVVNPKGNNAGKQSIAIGKANQAPIMGFELVLVGPGSGESATLSSGSGIFQYLASSLMMYLLISPHARRRVPPLSRRIRSTFRWPRMPAMCSLKRLRWRLQERCSCGVSVQCAHHSSVTRGTSNTLGAHAAIGAS